MRKILVTGGTVFVSRFIAEHYVAKGDEVYVLNRNTRPQSAGVKLIQADRHAIKIVENNMEEDIDLILAVGAGTIHDISRYICLLYTSPSPRDCS